VSVTKPQTFNADLEHLPAVLAPLTKEPRWVVWPWELRTTKSGKEKWTKPPRQARDPSHNARSNDPTTWGTYEEAVTAVRAGNADGIGYMLLNSNVGAIDLDHCVDRDAGAKLDPWAQDLHEEATGTYQEVTVSGGGLRIIGTVNGPETHRKFTFDRKTGAGVELYRNTARYITVSGLQMGSCAALPPLDGFIDALIVRFAGGTHQGNGLDFNDAGPQQTSLDYGDLIRNGAPEGKRGELFQAVVWHLAGNGWTADQVADELARYPNGIGAKYAVRLHVEVTRSYDKWRRHKRSAAAGKAPINDPWPQIYVVASELPRVVNEAEQALLVLRNWPLYQRGDIIVRPVLSRLKAADNRETQGWRLVQVNRPHMVETLTRAARFWQYNARAKGFVPIDAPEKVADAYLARHGTWNLPIIAGIASAPFLRPDGSLCDRPGYDAQSCVLFSPDEAFPTIPQQPSKSDAVEALGLIEKLIETFPFVSRADKAVALAGIFTALDRRAMPTAPLHAFTAPSAGTGKSLLVDSIAMLATGRLMPVISQGRSEEEFEKRLGAALLAGDAVISIDNCDRQLSSALLCQALTQQHLNIRLLGFSKNVETPVNAAIFATGNNLTIAGDLTRRTLLCALDARCERPELRTFDIDVLETVRANRGALVAAVLTVLRAWHVARRNERVELPAFGSFEEWSRRIREPLVWLGHVDPCETITKVRENDPTRIALNAVLVQWKENLGFTPHTVQQVIGRALTVSDFQAALVAVAGSHTGIMVVSDRLGRWLKKVEGRIMNGLMLTCSGLKDGYPLWQLVSVPS
jgi:hypothetical protein